MADRQRTTADILKERAKQKQNVERFITIRMWVSLIAARMFKDRGSIPSNIGGNIFIGNNQFITKNSMTAIIYITEFGPDTPVGFIGTLIRQAKKIAKNSKIDFVLKTQPYKFDAENGGFKSRERQWVKIVNNPAIPKSMKSRFTRLLYSAQILKEGHRGFKTYPYIYVRSDNGRDLSTAIKEVRAVLNKYKIQHKEIKSDLELHINNTWIISNKFADKLSDLKPSLFSATTLAEILPNTQGMNDKTGVIFGFDRRNNTPYIIDLKKYAEGKNILTIGPAGQGKTFFALNISKDAHSCDFRLCNTDIKGNEFRAITESLGGITISMAQSDNRYINTFRLPQNVSYESNSKSIFTASTALSIELMTIIIDPTAEEKSACDTMLIDFIGQLYRSIGVESGNIGSWSRSKNLDAYTVAEKFEEYLGSELREKYGKFAFKALDRIYAYMNRQSTNSYIFHKELIPEEILNTTCLTFDFNMMSKETSYDETIFKIKFMYSNYMKNMYIGSNKEKGLWTWINDEEAQYAPDYVAKAYKYDVTVRRAQNCVVNIICNSVTSLLSVPEFKAVLGNIKIQIIGGISKMDREFMMNEYNLHEYETVLKNIAKDPLYKRAFLLVNGLQAGAPTAIAQAYVPDKVAKGRIYQTVDIK